jgi:hypothetical protein
MCKCCLVTKPKSTRPAPKRQLVTFDDVSSGSMDDLLDGESDRRVEPPGRLSLGPLAPGAYVIELQGSSGRRQERIRIVDHDVYTIVR